MNWFAGSAGDAMVTELLYERFGERYDVLCLPDFNVAHWHFPKEVLLLFFLMSLDGHCAEEIWCNAMHMSFWGSNRVCWYWLHSFVCAG